MECQWVRIPGQALQRVCSGSASTVLKQFGSRSVSSPLRVMRRFASCVQFRLFRSALICQQIILHSGLLPVTDGVGDLHPSLRKLDWDLPLVLCKYSTLFSDIGLPFMTDHASSVMFHSAQLLDRQYCELLRPDIATIGVVNSPNNFPSGLCFCFIHWERWAPEGCFFMTNVMFL